MAKMFKNSKSLFAFVVAFAVIAASLFTGVAMTASAAAETIYWDGTVASSFADTSAGTEGDPIEIQSAEEFALMISNTEGKYFKIADGIKEIILQSEANAAAIKGITSGDNAKTVYEGLTGLHQWFNKSQATFDGHFDGNGVAIYGLYRYDSYAATTYWDGAALFPKATSTSTFKNFAVRNSYVSQSEFAAIVIGSVSGTTIMTLDNIEVSNNYILNTHSQAFRAGILLKGNSQCVVYSNILAYGNNCYYCTTEHDVSTITESNFLIASMSNSYKPDTETATNYNDFSNSVILDCFPAAYDKNAAMAGNYSNIYTTCTADDMADNSWSPAGDFAGKVFTITDDDVKGDAAKTACPNLDWENTWFAGVNAPALRAFHGEFLFMDDATHHYYQCSDCDLTGEKIAHTYEKSGDKYLCTTCLHTCLHDGLHGMTSYQSEGDCVTAAGTYVDCPCGYSDHIVTGPAATGHVFTHFELDCGDCQTEGTAEHWHCEVCNEMFTTNDVMAPMDSAVTLIDLNLGLGSHQKVTDADGTVVFNNETGHWYKCGVCDGRLNSESSLTEAEEVEDHEFEDGVCTECEWECTHDFEFTGKLTVIGNCETDEMSEVVCTICGIKGETVTKEAGHSMTHNQQVEPNDKMEGTKEHYICEICQKIFADKDGKTPVKQASLIIPRKINANGLTNVIPGENIDTGDKSPSTGEDIMLVIAATAALMGAAFVVLRKVKKA